MTCGCTTSLTIRLTADKRQDAEDYVLPPYTIEERIRELRQRLVLLRWRAQRLRTRSTQLVHK
jgi:hypothetical protein